MLNLAATAVFAIAFAVPAFGNDTSIIFRGKCTVFVEGLVVADVRSFELNGSTGSLGQTFEINVSGIAPAKLSVDMADYGQGLEVNFVLAYNNGGDDVKSGEAVLLNPVAGNHLRGTFPLGSGRNSVVCNGSVTQ